MDNLSLLVAAMAEQCRGRILEWDAPDVSLPKALQPKHLLWMCNKIEEHAENGRVTKLHRWIGFVQCAMLAHRMLDLDAAKAMFNEAKVAHGETGEDFFGSPRSPEFFRGGSWRRKLDK